MPISDLSLSPRQALYAARPAWTVAATATAVWGGATGCLGLILRKRWAMPLLIWLWTLEELYARRGYYAVQDASSPHWKYFWFD